MPNKSVFPLKLKQIKMADSKNSAGGNAFISESAHALAQIACTNCFNGTFYASAEANLELAKQFARQVLKENPEFVAKVALYSRENGYMKDMPAFLTVMLSDHPYLFNKVFPKVVDNGKMLRNVIQMARSGACGRERNMSGHMYRNAIQNWFASRNSEQIFKASIGNDPSMRDILRMARPKPENAEKAALYAYLVGAKFDDKENVFVSNSPRNEKKEVSRLHKFSDLPPIVQQFETFKKTHNGEIPNVDFRMLDSVLSKDELKQLWRRTAQNANWTMTRMNLNNFEKYGVFEDKSLLSTVAARLRNREEINKARAFPYQLLMAYNAAVSVPVEIKDALQDALEIATENVPKFSGKIYLCIDTSGSMQHPVTGDRGSVTTNVRCIDVAGLFASCILRKNTSATVIPFAESVKSATLNSRDTVLTNARLLAGLGGGGTNCSAPLASLNKTQAIGDAVIYISDYESWIDNNYGRTTGMMAEWKEFQNRNNNAKLICMDLTPRGNSQVKEHKNILQVGGFSDASFSVIASFLESNQNSSNHWVDLINKISLED